MTENTVIRLARVPAPGPLASDVFECSTEPLLPLAAGQIRVRTIHAAVDGGVRGMLDPAGDYPLILKVGDPVPTSTAVGEVVESRHPLFPVGRHVRAMLVSRSAFLTLDPLRNVGVRLVEADLGPLHLHCGALGVTGFTAWTGLSLFGRPDPGGTVLVSAAAGAVGSVAGQLARLGGARVIGTAGGAEKCAEVVARFGLDACLDYRAPDLAQAMAETIPEGIDVYFDNVGGEVLDLAFARMNRGGRIVLCGQVSQYGNGKGPSAPNLMSAIGRRLQLSGYIAADHFDQLPAFDRLAPKLVRDVKLVGAATVIDGIERLHDCVNALGEGRNIGQLIHRMGAEG